MFGNGDRKTGFIAPKWGTLKTPDTGSKDKETDQ